jgi:hypothetical protein
LSSGPVRPALTTLWTATACGLCLTDERSPARAPCDARPCPRARCPPQGQRCSPAEPGWPGTSRPAGHGPAPWPDHLGPAGRPAGLPSRRACAGSSACRRGCASSPRQRPSQNAGHRRSRPSAQSLVRRRRR